MDVNAILTLVTKIVSIASAAIDAGESAAPYIEKAYNLLKTPADQLTQADLDKLEAEVDAMSEELDVPLPPDDGTTTT